MDASGSLQSVRFGLLLGLLTILYGWSLGVTFGVNEDGLRDRFFVQPARAARAVYVERAKGDEVAADAAIKRMDETCWRYIQRAHFHAGGIGAIVIASSLLLAQLSIKARWKAVTSALLGAGGLGYALSWMFAAFRAPALGTTGAAKESLKWLSMPSGAALMIGALLSLGFVVSELFLKSRQRPAKPATGGSVP